MAFNSPFQLSPFYESMILFLSSYCFNLEATSILLGMLDQVSHWCLLSLWVESLIESQSCTDLTLFCSRLSYFHLRLQIHTLALGFLRSDPETRNQEEAKYVLSWLGQKGNSESGFSTCLHKPLIIRGQIPPLLHLLLKQSQTRMLTRTGFHLSLLLWQMWDSFAALALSTF